MTLANNLDNPPSYGHFPSVSLYLHSDFLYLYYHVLKAANEVIIVGDKGEKKEHLYLQSQFPFQRFHPRYCSLSMSFEISIHLISGQPRDVFQIGKFKAIRKRVIEMKV